MPMHGKVGATFNDSSARNKFGQNNANAGALGERYLANRLVKEFPQAHIWASLRSPSRDKRYNSDIDFAIVSGSIVLLIDAKRWSAGKSYWSFFGKPMTGMSPMKSENHKTGKMEWKPLSHNMDMCVDIMRRDLPHCTVKGLVVFTPTRKENGLPTSVGLLRWPGGIKSYLPDSAMRSIRRSISSNEPDPKAFAYLNRLIQK